LTQTLDQTVTAATSTVGKALGGLLGGGQH
jgi:hypothetical protein